MNPTAPFNFRGNAPRKKSRAAGQKNTPWEKLALAAKARGPDWITRSIPVTKKAAASVQAWNVWADPLSLYLGCE